jgi:hypothetical protein
MAITKSIRQGFNQQFGMNPLEAGNYIEERCDDSFRKLINSSPDANAHEINKVLREQDPYKGLNPKNSWDAKEILNQYDSRIESGLDQGRTIPQEVIDARITLARP